MNIVGGGIIGNSIAWRSASEGATVIEKYVSRAALLGRRSLSSWRESSVTGAARMLEAPLKVHLRHVYRLLSGE